MLVLFFRSLREWLKFHYSFILGFIFVFFVFYLECSLVESFLLSIFLYLSLLLHELGHLFAVIHKRRKKNVKFILIHALGGTLFLNKDFDNGRVEGYVALSGPIVSLFLSFAFYIYYSISDLFFFNVLSVMNFLIAIFNLIPLYPLDGGRVLRAVLILLGFNVYKSDIFLKFITFLVSLILMGISIYYSYKHEYMEFVKFYALGFFLFLFVIKDISLFISNKFFFKCK